MMDKDNFADIEWSKKLGKYFPDAEYWRWDNIETGDTLIQNKRLPHPFTTIQCYPCVTTDMALEVLPSKIIKDDVALYFEIRRRHEFWYVAYRSFKNIIEEIIIEKEDQNLTNALCAMIEWLDKEGLIK